MAKTKTETKTLERTYNIPLRKEYLKVPRWKRTKKAVSAVKQFLQKHMKAEEVKLGKHLNEKLWKHGIKNPPHHIKIITIKDGKGIVKAELFGHKIETEKKEKKKPSKLQEMAKKAGVKIPAKKETKKEDKVEEKKPEEKKTEKPAEEKKETKEETPKPSEIKPEEKKEEPKESKEKTKPTESAKTQKKF
jgi:large subunit ribosomal protein L31e